MCYAAGKNNIKYWIITYGRYVNIERQHTAGMCESRSSSAEDDVISRISRDVHKGNVLYWSKKWSINWQKWQLLYSTNNYIYTCVHADEYTNIERKTHQFHHYHLRSNK